MLYFKTLKHETTVLGRGTLTCVIPSSDPSPPPPPSPPFHPFPPKWQSSYYNSSSVCLCVCLCVCSLPPPRSFDGSSPNLVGVCRWTSHLPLRGSFPKRSTGRWVNGSLSLSTSRPIIYAPASRHTAAKGPFCFAAAAAESNSAPFAALHLNSVCRWTSQLPLRGSFSKRSTGRRVKWVDGSHLDGVCRWTSQLPLRGSFSKRSTGRRVKQVDGSTGHFHFHYIIYDSRRRQAHATPLQKAHGV